MPFDLEVRQLPNKPAGLGAGTIIMTFFILGILIAGVVFVVWIILPSKPKADVKSDKVQVFTDTNYKGTMAELTTGNFDSQQLGVSEIKSIKLPEKYTVTVFSEAGFTGTTKEIKSNTSDIGQAVKSIKIVKEVVYKVQFYSDANYTGTMAELGIGDHDESSIVSINNLASSVKIPNGVKVTLFDESGFKGVSKVLFSDTPNLTDFNDKVSSIKIEKTDEAKMASFYVDTDYNGSVANLPIGNYDSNSLIIGAKVISSLKVPSGLKVTLYDEPGWGGNSQVYTSDTPNVGADWNDKAQSIKIE